MTRLYQLILWLMRWLLSVEVYGGAERRRQLAASLRRRPPLPDHRDLLDADAYLNEWYPT